jgi:mismatch-specific thymine-DNA glycosylase
LLDKIYCIIMPNFKTTITVNEESYETLSDILPDKVNQLDILFIAKVPTKKSVCVGHYFQGSQGKGFWNKLQRYNILKVEPNTFEDENLIDNNYGLTDIVKIPRDFSNEPSDIEYKEGLERILTIIKKYNPKIIVFVYKKVLDRILQHGFGLKHQCKYGFNKELEGIFNSEVFVFPMNRLRYCTTEQSNRSMTELETVLKNNLIVK